MYHVLVRINFGKVQCGKFFFWINELRSPDGSLLLLRSESHMIYVLKRSPDAPEKMELCYSHQAPSPILSLKWFGIPAYSDDDAHWCYVMSCRDMPVEFIDTHVGQVRLCRLLTKG